MSVTIPASVVRIADYSLGWAFNEKTNATQRVDGFTIYGYSSTAAQTYAEENEFTFIALTGFTDVKELDYFINPVMWEVNHDPQISTGAGEGQFCPTNSCTRAQIVAFLCKACVTPQKKNRRNQQHEND